MIDLSFGKLFLVALIALIVLGPEKLPGAARTVGAILRRMRGGWDSVRAEVERELQVEEIKHAAHEAAGQANATRAGIETVLRDLHQPLRKVAGMLSEPVAIERDITKSASLSVAIAPLALHVDEDNHPVKPADGSVQ